MKPGLATDKAERKSSGVVSAENVSVRLGNRLVLRDVNFNIAAGEFVACIGPNGAGKSTLLRLLLGLIHPSAGKVSIFGQPVRRGSNRVGYIPQEHTIHDSMRFLARELVELGIDGTRYGPLIPSASKTERVNRALDEVRATAYADAPAGLLSGGERQRLMLAQAIVGNPDLLLLDEPLSNLDLRSRREVVDLVKDICTSRHIAVIFVAHDVNPLLRVMDRVLYLADGRAVIGTPEEVVQSDVLTDLFGFPVQVIRAEGYVLVTSMDEGDHCHA